MSEYREEREVVSTTPAVTRADSVQTVTADPDAAQRWAAYRAGQVVYLILGVIEGLLAIRFVLRLLGANPGAGFAAFIYGVTAPLLAPFAGLFGTPAVSGSALEVNTLVAMVVYALAFWLIVKLVRLLFVRPRARMVTQTVETHRVEPPR